MERIQEKQYVRRKRKSIPELMKYMNSQHRMHHMIAHRINKKKSAPRYL